MLLITKKLLEKYLQHDPISSFMNQLSRDEDEGLTCQRWLRESPPKRLLFELLYDGLLEFDNPRQRVLDVGGGPILHPFQSSDSRWDVLIREVDHVVLVIKTSWRSAPFNIRWRSTS